ncbi:RNA ligase family protein [Mycolicibacterium neoaurum]|uniref:RNA ligase family protein n=1 Tax=Mycolicibacterium neoaurum TaxID=1795 RepID=UPI001ABE017B
MAQDAADTLFSGPTIVTEKMDGGNVTLARDYFHARSTNSGTPPWERYAKTVWGKVAHDIPAGWRVSAESLWAQRSVPYANLPSYLMVIGVWNETELLPWTETVEWAHLLDLPTVPVLGVGESERQCLELWSTIHSPESSEGFVVRAAGAVPYREFGNCVAKWVRPNHVRTAAAWRHSAAFPTNGLAPEAALTGS